MRGCKLRQLGAPAPKRLAGSGATGAWNKANAHRWLLLLAGGPWGGISGLVTSRRMQLGLLRPAGGLAGTPAFGAKHVFELFYQPHDQLSPLVATNSLSFSALHTSLESLIKRFARERRRAPAGVLGRAGARVIKRLDVCRLSLACTPGKDAGGAAVETAPCNECHSSVSHTAALPSFGMQATRLG